MSAPQVTRLRVEVLEVLVPLEVVGDDLAAAVAAAWTGLVPVEPRAELPVTAAMSVAVGTWDDGDVTGADVPEVLHRLTHEIVTRATVERAGELVILNAAAVADPRTGATAVLVGPAGTGLTTAAIALGHRFAYLSDEVTCIDAEGVVQPLRKPLSIRSATPAKQQVPASELGLLTTDAGCRLAALVILTRDPTHVGPPQVAHLPTVDALAALAAQTRFLGHLDRPLQRLADLVRHVGGVRSVTYAEADSLVPVVHQLVAEGTR